MLNRFLELVRAGIAGGTPRAELFASLCPQEWRLLYEMSRKQTVTGICYSAISRLPDAAMPPIDQLMRWVAATERIENASLRGAEATRRLLALFEERGLHPVVQKGLAVARFYPEPSLREQGDIDLWFENGDFSRVETVIEDLGGNPQRHADGAVSFAFNGYEVECHSTLIGLRTPATRRSLRDEIVSRGRHHTADGLPVPAPEMEMLLYTVHIMKHVFGVGIGIRQFCDYVLAAGNLKGKYDAKQFAVLLRRYGLARWTATLNRFATEYMGADPADLPDAGYRKDTAAGAARLLRIVEMGGNFGQFAAAAPSGGNAFFHKLKTFSTFLRRSRFSLSIAPREAFWMAASLLRGQIKN